MSQHERGRGYKKKYISKDIPNNVGRSFFNSKSKRDDEDENKREIKMKQPTILLKNREPVAEVVNSPKKTTKDQENQITGLITNPENHSTPQLKFMHESMKFLSDGSLITENLQEFVTENSDFLVIGVVGLQGVGKSTILNLLANSQIDSNLLAEVILKKQYSNEDINLIDKFKTLNLQNVKEIFKVQDIDDLENNRNETDGIDLYISENRVIFLDCQPFISMSIMDELVENENKRSNLISEFIPSENSGEIQALQITAFLMSVCHILLVVQDWFFDSNVCRFIQTAEMLKPTVSSPEDESSEHFPHLLLIQNRATVDDFSPLQFKTIQKTYRSIFSKSKLVTESSLGMASGRLIKHLNQENCDQLLNVFLIPEYNEDSESSIYRGHPPMVEILKKLKSNILGATKHPLTHVSLNEKTWLIYCVKVWENIRKSSFFVEYSKLLP